MGGGGGGAKNGWSISRGGRLRALAEWRRGVVFFGLSWAAAAAAAAAASKSMNLPPPPGPPGTYFRFFEGGPSGESKEPLLDDLREDLGLLRDGRPEIECRTVGAIIQERAFEVCVCCSSGMAIVNRTGVRSRSEPDSGRASGEIKVAILKSCDSKHKRMDAMDAKDARARGSCKAR